MTQDRNDCRVVCSVWYHPDVVVSQTLSYSSYHDAINHIRWVYNLHPWSVKAIWECGIDVHRPGGYESLDKQKELFSLQCDLAQELHLPVVIHSRDDRSSTRDIVSQYPDVVFYRHCRGYDVDQLRIIQSKFEQYMIGYTGIITYPKAQSIRNCLSLTAIQHIAIETDAPYLAPVPHRGQSNEPAYVQYVYEYIARILDVSMDHLCQQIENNFVKLYKI
jgi:TatD DNase family protein